MEICRSKEVNPNLLPMLAVQIDYEYRASKHAYSGGRGAFFFFFFRTAGNSIASTTRSPR